MPLLQYRTGVGNSTRHLSKWKPNREIHEPELACCNVVKSAAAAGLPFPEQCSRSLRLFLYHLLTRDLAGHNHLEASAGNSPKHLRTQFLKPTE